MSQRLRRVFHDLGVLAHVPAVMCVLSLPVALVDGDRASALGFVATATLAGGLGQALVRVFRRCSQWHRRDAIATVAAGWMLVSVLGAGPFFVVSMLAPAGSAVVASWPSFVDALFESTSGFTSCGLTLASASDQLPAALQWWRSFAQWVGGVGVFAVALAVIEPAEEDGALYREEVAYPSDRPDHVRASLLRMWVVYTGYTVAVVLAFLAVGVPPWEATNHGMAAIATGGFTISGDSFISASVGARLIAMVAMLLGAISFRVHVALWFRRRPVAVWRSSQTRWLVVALGTGSAAVIAIAGRGDAQYALDLAFMWVSALCTCGFSTLGPSSLHAFVVLGMMGAMIVGGAAGSTSGGIKLSRAIWLTRGIVSRVRQQAVGERRDRSWTMDGSTVDDDRAMARIHAASAMLALWLTTVLFGALLLAASAPGHTADAVLFESISAAGSVGLSSGLTDVSLPSGAKIVLVTLMWMGRLELIAVLVLALRGTATIVPSMRSAREDNA